MSILSKRVNYGYGRITYTVEKEMVAELQWTVYPLKRLPTDSD